MERKQIPPPLPPFTTDAAHPVLFIILWLIKSTYPNLNFPLCHQNLQPPRYPCIPPSFLSLLLFSQPLLLTYFILLSTLVRCVTTYLHLHLLLYVYLHHHLHLHLHLHLLLYVYLHHYHFYNLDLCLMWRYSIFFAHLILPSGWEVATRFDCSE